MATKPKVGQIAVSKPRFEEVDGDGHVFQGVNFYDDTPAPVAAPAPAVRSWGDAVADTGRGMASGVGGLVKGGGTLYGLATGNMDNGATELGDSVQQYWEDGQSQILKDKKKARQAAIDSADGTLAKAGTALWETVKDPALAMDTVATNAATMLPGMAAGRLVAGASAARGLNAASKFGPATLAAREAAQKAAGSLGTKVAIGAGAVQQGADVAQSVYEDAMKKPDAAWAQNPDFMAELAKTDGSAKSLQETKHKFALMAARVTMPVASAVSVGANMIPGADMLERALVGGGAKVAGKGGVAAVAKSMGKGALGEAAQETLEEGGGAFAGNVAKQRFTDPNQDLMEKVGENAGMGAAGGLLMGAGGGAFASRAATEDPAIAAAKLLAEQQAAAKKAAVSAAHTAAATPNSPIARAAAAANPLTPEEAWEKAQELDAQAALEEANGVAPTAPVAEVPPTDPIQDTQNLIDAGLAQAEQDKAAQRAAMAQAAQQEEQFPPAQAGDILNMNGKPFKKMETAMMRQRRLGDGHEVVRVDGGLAIRPTAKVEESAPVDSEPTQKIGSGLSQSNVEPVNTAQAATETVAPAITEQEQERAHIESRLQQSDAFGDNLEGKINQEVESHGSMIRRNDIPSDSKPFKLFLAKKDHAEAAAAAAQKSFDTKDFSHFDAKAGKSGKTYSQLYPRTSIALQGYIEANTPTPLEVQADKPVESGKQLAKVTQLKVSFGGRYYPVDSINDAQDKWVAFRDATGAGVSEIGNGVPVTDQDGKLIARISYNGRAWASDADNAKLLAESPENRPTKPLAGQPIDKDWTAFHPDSGTLNVPRADMPQIKAEHRGAMVNFLKARGIDSTQEEVPTESLKPTQTEYSPEKVDKAKGFTGNDRSILVSSDGHVLDGHHQWVAKHESGEPVKVIRLDAPIDALLSAVREFPSAETTVNSTTQEQTAENKSASDAERKLVKVYESIMALKSTELKLDDGRGRKLYAVKLTPEFKNKHFVHGRMPSADGLEMKSTADITGDPYDKGYTLIDNREQLAARRKQVSQPQESPSAQTAEAQQTEPQQQEGARADAEHATGVGEPAADPAGASPSEVDLTTVEGVARAVQVKVAANRRKSREKSRKERDAKGYAPNSTPESEQADYEAEISAQPSDMQKKSAAAMLGTDPLPLIGMFVNGNFEASEDVFKAITGVKIRGLSAAAKKAALYQWAKWTPEQIAQAEGDVQARKDEAAEKHRQDDLKSAVMGAWLGLDRLKVKEKDGTQTTGQDFVLKTVASGFDKAHSQKKGAAVIYGLTDGSRFTTLKAREFTAFVKSAIAFGGLDKALSYVNPPKPQAPEGFVDRSVDIGGAKDDGMTARAFSKPDAESAPQAEPAAPAPEAGAPSADPAPVKWFGTRDKAGGYIIKNKLAKTHEVVDAGKSRFEVREKAPAENPVESAAETEWTRTRDVDRMAMMLKLGYSEEVARRTAGKSWENVGGVFQVKLAKAMAEPLIAATPTAPTGEDALYTSTAKLTQPYTLDDFIGNVDAGYRAHFEYAGADGRTLWIERVEGGWVLKSKDDGSTTTITKGGAGAGGRWDKLDAMRAAENDAKHRYTEWKPVSAADQHPTKEMINEALRLEVRNPGTMTATALSAEIESAKQRQKEEHARISAEIAAKKKGEATSETARKAEFALKDGNRVKVVENATRGVFTVSVANAKGENFESYGTFQMDDQFGISRVAGRANWAMDAVREASYSFVQQQKEQAEQKPASKMTAEAWRELLDGGQERLSKLEALQANAGDNAWTYDRQIAEARKTVENYREAYLKSDAAKENDKSADSLPTPPDGWEGNLIKARVYARSLMDAKVLNPSTVEGDKWNKLGELLPAIYKAIDGWKPGSNFQSSSPAVQDFIDGKRDDAPTIEEVKAEASPLVQAMNFLMELEAKLESQGRVADDRLVQMIRQQKEVVKELEAKQETPSQTPSNTIQSSPEDAPIDPEDRSVLDAAKAKIEELDSKIERHEALLNCLK